MSQTLRARDAILKAEKETGMAEKVLPIINKKKCTVCGLCVDACPEEVLSLISGELTLVNPQDCIYCATCEETCPENAVRCEFEIHWAS